MATDPALRVHLLGAFRVLVADQPVSRRAWRSRRAADLVKLLALAPDHRLHHEQVADAIWPDLDPGAQRNNLNQNTHRARLALATAGAPPDVFLIRDGDALVLGDPKDIWIDVAAFETALAAAWRQAGDPALFHAALALAPGDLLVDDLYEDWTEPRRTDIRAARIAALAHLGHLHRERGEIQDAIEAFANLLGIDPIHEEATVALMRLNADQGRRELALAHFDRLADALRRELDAAPESATIELAQAIRSEHYQAQAAPAPVPATHLPPDNLPLALDPLVGRDAERVELGHTLATARLMTLTGPGGIGKTRLACAVAADQRQAFPDGIVFVNLAPVRDPELVGSVIAQTLDISEQSGHPAIEAVAAHLRDQRLLLVLDNFEQVADGAPLVRVLLERAPRLTILVTSRTSLRLSGEREFPVPPLSVPDAGLVAPTLEIAAVPAVTLFVQRAQGVKPGFHLTNENGPVVAEICRRLDGLPLAIELAAARVKVLTPETMLTRLDRPLALLVGGRRDQPERQQTVRRTIAWSYNLLSAPEQRLFHRMATFVGGWSLDAAEAICDPDGALGIAVLDGLSSLVDKSLVQQRDQPNQSDGVRFGMLETIREFAVERLTESEDHESIHLGHSAWFLALAERARPHLESSDQAIWFNRLEREEGNLRAALDHARERGDAELGLRLVIALQMYWFIRGRIGEGCDQTLGVLALPRSAEFPVLRADALNGVGLLARDGDEVLSLRVSLESREIARRVGDRKREADAVANLGYLALQRGDLEEAQRFAGEVLAISRSLANRQSIADATSVLALVAFQRNDLDTATRLNEESIALWEALDDDSAIVWARTRLAPVLIQRGEQKRALCELESALETARRLDFRWGQSWAFDALAQLAAALAAHHTAAFLATAGAAVRAAAGLTPSAAEQAEIDRLRHRLVEALGNGALDAVASPITRERVDEEIRALRSLIDIAPATPGLP